MKKRLVVTIEDECVSDAEALEIARLFKKDSKSGMNQMHIKQESGKHIMVLSDLDPTFETILIMTEEYFEGLVKMQDEIRNSSINQGQKNAQNN